MARGEHWPSMNSQFGLQGFDLQGYKNNALVNALLSCKKKEEKSLENKLTIVIMN